MEGSERDNLQTKVCFHIPGMANNTNLYERREMKNKNIAVWFSCGAASAVAAKITIDKYSKSNNVFI